MIEGGGDKIGDYSLNGNHGANNGAVWVPGDDGPALSFDGTNSFVDVTGTEGFFAGVEQLSVCAMIKPAVNATRAILGSVDGAGDKLLALWTTPSGSFNRINWRVYNAAASGAVLTTVGRWLPDQWIFVVATWDGTTTRVYVNGDQDATTASQSGATGTSPRPMKIGDLMSGTAVNARFSGDMSRVCMLPKCLSDAEVREMADFPWQAWQRNNLPLFAAQGGVAPPTGSVNLLDGLFERKRLIA
jgi:hypothetical protein